MSKIIYIDRETGKEKEEEIYGGEYLRFLYGDTSLGKWLCHLLSKRPFFSHFYGFCQKLSITKRKILPFIKNFSIDTSEFLEGVHTFSSFNAFFIRKLKPSVRPIARGAEWAIIPADGRYLVFPNLSKLDGIHVKGQTLSLGQLLKDEPLAHRYKEGSLVIARLAPVDYHRFHFPVTCTPSKPKLIQGPLYSVNPIALRQRISILAENKREITTLKTAEFGTLLFIEVGATHVGTIHQTFAPGELYAKGDEKGYFSFGGSSILLLFEPGKIFLDADLLEATQRGREVYCKVGQTLGHSSQQMGHVFGS